MQLLFVHKNFPAQFGHVAAYLSQHHGARCHFVSEVEPRPMGPIEMVQFEPHGGTTGHTHFCCRTFENQIRASHGLYEVLSKRSDIKPDLIVSHSGFVSPLFLRNLYDVPIVNYFEYYYHLEGSDLTFRPEFVVSDLVKMRTQARNAMLLLDLENCDAGYSPTAWQKSRFPEAYQPKIRQIFDGIDTEFWRPRENARSLFHHWQIPDDAQVVTYASRGLESMRGFDVFMKVAQRLCDHRDNIHFLVIGEDRTNYGDETSVTGDKSFKEWVLSQDKYDLSRIHFLGRVPPQELATIFAGTDLHIYLTVPFVLSWSLINALSCGAVVLASNTPPVREAIEHGQNGLLAGFSDVDSLVSQAAAVLDNPSGFAPLRKEGRADAVAKYSVTKCLPQIAEFFHAMAGR